MRSIYAEDFAVSVMLSVEHIVVIILFILGASGSGKWHKNYTWRLF